MTALSTGELSAEGQRRVCVLTGAGGKLGNAFCQKYAADYEIVAVCRRRPPDVPSQLERYVDPLAPTDESINAASVYVIYADLSQPGEVERVVELVMARYGRVDLLVNNAAETAFHPTGLADGEQALADFDRFYTTNVGAPLRLAVRFAQRFWHADAADNRAHNRNVVNISSLSGHQVYSGGQGIYASTKAALNHLTRHLALEYQSFGVRVNGLSPTSFPALIPSEEVADAVVRLDRESVTGKILRVDVEDVANGAERAG